MIPKTLNFLRGVLHQAGGGDCELGFLKTRKGLTRFMENSVHQTTEQHDRRLDIRVVQDGRPGIWSTNRFDQDSVAGALQCAVEAARAAPPARRPVCISSGVRIACADGYSEITARAQPFDRVQMINEAVKHAAPAGAVLSGSLSTAEQTFCVLTSRGSECYEERTIAEFNLLAERDGFSGYAYWVGGNLSALPLKQLVGEAVALLDACQPRQTLEPGVMTAVLDTHAVGMLASFLAYAGFGAKAFLEGRSFLNRRLGRKIASNRFSMWDDATSTRLPPRRFDHEGFPRRRVALVDQGVARALITDSGTAPLVEQPNTGHAPPLESTEGPLPENLFVAPGESSLPAMIRSTRRGVFVRRFHYVNLVDPTECIVTGLTRDGTRLIENGRLGPRLSDMRFTVSLLDVFSSITSVSREVWPVEGALGPVEAPAMKISRFSFNAVSEQ